MACLQVSLLTIFTHSSHHLPSTQLLEDTQEPVHAYSQDVSAACAVGCGLPRLDGRFSRSVEAALPASYRGEQKIAQPPERCELRGLGRI